MGQMCKPLLMTRMVVLGLLYGALASECGSDKICATPQAIKSRGFLKTRWITLGDNYAECVSTEEKNWIECKSILCKNICKGEKKLEDRMRGFEDFFKSQDTDSDRLQKARILQQDIKKTPTRVTENKKEYYNDKKKQFEEGLGSVEQRCVRDLVDQKSIRSSRFGTDYLGVKHFIPAV